MKREIESDTEIKVINLQPGDIVIEVEVTPEGGLEPKHTWIFASKDPVVAHSATGGDIGIRIRGVTRHSFDQLVFRSNKVVILRCINKKLNELIINVAESFAPVYKSEEREELKKLNVKPHNPEKVNVWKEKKINYTPYSMVREQSESNELNQFRSVRDALRTGITKTKKAPLSKICGVSCDEFVGFTIQSALVIFLLDKKVTQLEYLVEAISATRKEVELSSGKKKKAKDLLAQFSKEFKKLSEEQKLPNEIKRTEVLAAISHCVKGNTIKNSMPFWESLSLFYRFEGVFSINPFVVQLQSLAELITVPNNSLPFQDGDPASDSESDESILRKNSMDSNSDDGLDNIKKNLAQTLAESQNEKSSNSLATLNFFSRHSISLSKDDFKLLERDQRKKQQLLERRRHSFYL